MRSLCRLSFVAAILLALTGCASSSSVQPSAPTLPQQASPVTPEPSPQASSQDAKSQDPSTQHNAAQKPAGTDATRDPGSPQVNNATADALREEKTGATDSGARALSHGDGLTEAEQQAILDGRLQHSLSEFERRLQREQAAMQQQSGAAAEKAGVESARSSGSEETGTGAVTRRGSGVPAHPASDSGSPQSVRNTTGPGGAPGNNLPVPKGTPDGRDDDVVARQLREAAENEKDPALRELLWKEYSEYKRK